MNSSLRVLHLYNILLLYVFNILYTVRSNVTYVRPTTGYRNDPLFAVRARAKCPSWPGFICFANGSKEPRRTKRQRYYNIIIIIIIRYTVYYKRNRWNVPKCSHLYAYFIKMTLFYCTSITLRGIVENHSQGSVESENVDFTLPLKTSL